MEWFKLKFFEVDLEVISTTLASVLVVGGLFGWIRELPKNRVLQMIAVGCFVGPTATIIALRFWHLDDFWCIPIGAVSSLLGMPLLVKVGVIGPSLVDAGVDAAAERAKQVAGINTTPKQPGDAK
jgi:hypothetical protein